MVSMKILINFKKKIHYIQVGTYLIKLQIIKAGQ